jgi:long-chain fatty acid transport protein
MKKVLFAVLAACSLASAESYQVNTLSAKQLGMGHTGAGQKLGSESMHYNPGGLGFLDKTLDISAGVTFIIPEVEYHGGLGKTVNEELGTPLYVYVGSSITNWFSAGLSFTTPYGNTVDYGENWEGADLLQNISLAVYALQPTVAFKFLDKISIGGGPAIYFGSFEQSKRLIPAGALNAYSGLAAINPEVSGILSKYADSPVSATFSGDADVAVVANVGILYDLLPNKFALGIAYRSEAKMKVANGKAKITDGAQEDINGLNQTITTVNGMGVLPNVVPSIKIPPTLDGDKFEAELPLPANLNLGISFRPIDKLLLAFDLQRIFWGTYKDLTLTFDNSPVGADATGAPSKKQISKKEYEDTFAYRFGAQYTLINQLDLRLGIYYDETPVDDDYLTPESPSTNKLGTTIGFSFRPIPNLSIDASFLYALGFGRDATSGDSNPNKPDGLDGRYEVQAWAPSVGVSFNF